MPPRLNLWQTGRALAFRSRPAPPAAQCRPLRPATAAVVVRLSRGLATDATPNNSNSPPSPAPSPTSPPSAASPSPIQPAASAASSPAADPTTQTAAPSSSPPTDSTTPLEQQQQQPPSLQPSSSLSSSLSSAEQTLSATVSAADAANQEALRQLELLSQGLNPFDPATDGHKYGLPERPMSPRSHLKDRYDPVIAQLTRLLMRDGKLGKAQRDMAMILNYLRTSASPKVNPARPLLPGAPPPSHLPLDPVLYLTLAVDSVAPLIKIRYYKNMAGGGRALAIPVPLAARQRRRTAFTWLLDVVARRPSRGSGRAMLAHRIGEELVAVVEGRSSLWEKRQLVHKLGTSSRANLAALRKKR